MNDSCLHDILGFRSIFSMRNAMLYMALDTDCMPQLGQLIPLLQRAINLFGFDGWLVSKKIVYSIDVPGKNVTLPTKTFMAQLLSLI